MSDRPPPRPAQMRPRAFRVEEAREPTPYVVEEQPDAYAREAALASLPPQEAAVEDAQRQGVLRRALWSWGGLFWTSAGALVSLAIGVWIDGLIESLFERFAALGWIALVLLAAALVALLALIGRELGGLFRQRRIAELHGRLAQAHLAEDREAARAGTRALASLYRDRPATAAQRAKVLSLTSEIVDARDLIEIAERTLVLPLDEAAQAEVARAARRVSAVTTVSPRAALDVLFVGAQAVRLVRLIAEIYGGRPGFVGLLRIGRSIASHIAITGGMAVGDSLVQQVVGHGVAARLSARLGEGVLNGMLTVRVGLSAIAVCRPAPFLAIRQPGVKDVAPFLFSGSDQARTEP